MGEAVKRPHRVVLVGHCGPDVAMLRMVVQRALGDDPGVEVSQANTSHGLSAAQATADLLLVNRVLDGGFDSRDGQALVRSMVASEAPHRPAIMLVSDLAEAQAAAEAAGALPGFGKSEAYAPETAARLRDAVAAGRRGKDGLKA